MKQECRRMTLFQNPAYLLHAFHIVTISYTSLNNDFPTLRFHSSRAIPSGTPLACRKRRRQQNAGCNNSTIALVDNVSFSPCNVKIGRYRRCIHATSMKGDSVGAQRRRLGTEHDFSFCWYERRVLLSWSCQLVRASARN